MGGGRRWMTMGMLFLLAVGAISATWALAPTLSSTDLCVSGQTASVHSAPPGTTIAQGRRVGSRKFGKFKMPTPFFSIVHKCTPNPQQHIAISGDTELMSCSTYYSGNATIRDKDVLLLDRFAAASAADMEPKKRVCVDNFSVANNRIIPPPGAVPDDKHQVPGPQSASNGSCSIINVARAIKYSETQSETTVDEIKFNKFVPASVQTETFAATTLELNAHELLHRCTADPEKHTGNVTIRDKDYGDDLIVANVTIIPPGPPLDELADRGSSALVSSAHYLLHTTRDFGRLREGHRVGFRKFGKFKMPTPSFSIVHKCTPSPHPDELSALDATTGSRGCRMEELVLLARGGACGLSGDNAAARLVGAGVVAAAARATVFIAAAVHLPGHATRPAAGSGTRSVGSIAGGLLGTLVLAAQVGPVRAYGCSSDAVCKYEGCNGRCKMGYCRIGSGWDFCSEPPACVAGTYSGDGKNAGGDRACQPCPAGNFVDKISGATTCNPCPPLTNSTAGSTTCNCITAFHEFGEMCQPCTAAPGDYCPAGSDATDPWKRMLLDHGAVACPSGHFCADPSNICGSDPARSVACPVSHYCPGGTALPVYCPSATSMGWPHCPDDPPTIGCDGVPESGKTLDVCGVCDGPGLLPGKCNCAGDVLDACGLCGGVGVIDECGLCGDGVLDECGVCNGPGKASDHCDCAGNTLDECGVCGGTGVAPGKCDCAGNVLDACGVCGGFGASCACDSFAPGRCDCAGNRPDACGVCGGDGSSCVQIMDCDGVPNGGKVFDVCGVCDGPGFPAGRCNCNGDTVDECGFCGGSGIPAGKCSCAGDVADACGACGGNNSSCAGCDGVPNSGKTVDLCGVCDGGGIAVGTCNCDGDVLDQCGVCGGSGVLDQCGVCGGSGIPAGKCNCAGDVTDACGTCGGDGSSCAGCDGIANSGKAVDLCGVCDGDGIVAGACSCAGDVLDECGVCGGSGIPASKCNCAGDVADACGVCGGDGSSCAGCDGIANSGKAVDLCGVCDGGGIAAGTCNCAGDVLDQCGVCGGSGIPAVKCNCAGDVADACGVCGGDGSSCAGCDGVANSGKMVDLCGVCDGGGIAAGTCNCDGDVLDQCGVCGGSGIPSGKCNCGGDAVDGCGVCGGDGSSCAGCDGVANSNKVMDLCGVCGGNGIASGTCNCAGDVLDECGVCGGVRVLDACGVCVDAGTRRGFRLYQDCGNADCLAGTGVTTSANEVRITLSLSMSLSAFTDDKQTVFKASLAQAAGVSSEAVVIYRIESVSSRRHLLAEAIRVETGIMTTDEAVAEIIVDRLTADNINSELIKTGLPTATVLEAAKVLDSSKTSTPEPSPSNEDSNDVAFASSFPFFSTAVLVGCVLGLLVCLVLGIVVCLCHRKGKRRATSPSLTSEAPLGYIENTHSVQRDTQGRAPVATASIVMKMAPTPASALTEQEEQDMLVAQRAQEEEEAAAREDTEQVIRREQSDAELARKTSESLDKDRKQQKASDAAMAHNNVVLEFHTELSPAPAFPAPPPPRDFPPAVMAGSLPAGDDSSDAGGFEEGSDSEMA